VKIPVQIDIFNDVSLVEKRERLDFAIEIIRRRFGKNSIRNAVLCTDIKLSGKHSVDLIMPTGMIG